MFSQVKKNESALDRIRGHQGEMKIHLGKMEVCQILKKKCNLGKANKISKKKTKNKKSSLG